MDLLVWVTVPVFIASTLIGQAGIASDTLAAVAPLMLCILIARVLVSAVARPRQRASLAALALGLLLWMVASIVVTTTRSTGTVQLPLSAVEWLFLCSYMGFAAFAFLDGYGRTRTTAAEVLQAVILTGGAACLAAVLLVPVSSAIGTTGASVLIALLYPLADVLIVLVLVTQIGIGRRVLDARSLMVLAGFTAIALADAVFARNLANGVYDSSVLLQSLWAAGWVLVGQGAARTRAVARDVLRPGAGVAVILTSAFMAMGVLAVPWPELQQWYVVLPALVTLVAAGARLLLSLDEARRSTEAYRRALIDDLTGLPNQRGLLDRVDADPRNCALLMIDIEGLKDVNSSFGHESGDVVLSLFGVRLAETLGPHGTAGRLGGDIFAALVDEADLAAAETWATRVRTDLARPFDVQGLEVVLDTTIGGAVRLAGEPASSLLRRAHLAMGHARAQHVGIAMYDPSYDASSLEHLQVAEALRHGVDGGEFVLWYQPQVDASTHAVIGLEALVRWAHPTRGILTPDAFLPTARRTGVMPALTDIVLRQAVHDCRSWADAGYAWTVSVNISPPELMSGTIAPSLRRLLAEVGLPPDRIVVEVTEDTFLADPARAAQVLADLSQQGMQVSVDDYGTGFSSLAYLRDLTAHEVKIDRTFTTDLPRDERAGLIVASTVQMAHALGLRVVAEGVETQEASVALADYGVDLLQGYLVARPMPADEVEPWARWRDSA